MNRASTSREAAENALGEERKRLVGVFAAVEERFGPTDPPLKTLLTAPTRQEVQEARRVAVEIMSNRPDQQMGVGPLGAQCLAILDHMVELCEWLEQDPTDQ